MRYRRYVSIAAFALALSACSKDKESNNNGSANADPNNVTVDGGPDANANITPNNVTDGGPNNMTVPPMPAEFGLDERPANPNCVAFDRPPAAGTVATEQAFPALNFSRPVWAGQSPSPADDRWFVVEQGGIVRSFANDDAAANADTFIDITDRVTLSGERGLLGLAFHPDWPNTPEVFLSYVNDFTSTISRFTSNDAGMTLDPASEDVVITISQTDTNHNGGGIAFGPDGYMYIGLGDGGGGGDPDETAQDLDQLLGKFLRIDVFGGDPYAIPSDNPFANGGGAPEIYAWGFRNPWRWSFDRETGELWAGDVGQGEWEEIDLVELGGNYGWDDKEGSRCFEVNPCDDGPWIDPIVEYDHSMGRRSVTGGFVYRGSAIPSLVGIYVFADFQSGHTYGIFDDAEGNPEMRLLFQHPGPISSFGEGQDGELYIVDYGAENLHRIVEAAPAAASNFPTLLSQTGCVDIANPDATPGLIPFSVNAPFWSDNAEKTRFIALPDGEQVTIEPNGDWTLPQGSVVVKHFRMNGQLFETRLMVHHADGEWGGYSYEWNADGTDATYVQGGKVAQVGGQDWVFPSSGDCMACHTAVAGRTLGLENAQLDGDFTYPSTNRLSNQIRTLGHIGIVPSDLDVDQIQELVDPFGSAPAVDRARSYLHTNCSQCHRSGTAIRPKFDLTAFLNPLIDDELCDAPPIGGDLGVTDALRLDPGSPDTSLLWLRMSRRDANGMPPLGSKIVDDPGAALVREWIEGLGDCEL